MNEKDSLLGFALMGLLHERPQSGYDLRKVFAQTAMGSFSDSPGAIYPALRRLEKRGLVRGTVAESASSRKRRVFQVTANGLAELKAWLNRPVTRTDVMRGIGELMLRFAFMELALGAKRSAQFLKEYEEQLAAYLPELREFHNRQARSMRRSARLAFESGIEEYETRLRWARGAQAEFRSTGRSKR